MVPSCFWIGVTLSSSIGLLWGLMLLMLLLLCWLLSLFLLRALIAGLVAALVSIRWLISGFFVLRLEALCVRQHMALLAILATADLAVFKTLEYPGQPVPEGFLACGYI